MRSICRGGMLAVGLALTAGVASAQVNPNQSMMFNRARTFSAFNNPFVNAQAFQFQNLAARNFGYGLGYNNGYGTGAFNGYGSGALAATYGGLGGYGGYGAGAFGGYGGGAGAGYGGYGGYPGAYSYLNDPYGYAAYGQTLKGEADITKAYGSLSTTYEQARIMREQAEQAKLDTRKKEFDLNLYIKANTPSYMENQTRIAKATMTRIQTSALPSEITGGKALNLLLDDLRKYPNKKTAIEPIMLSEGILARISVTKNAYGMGLLRDYGKFTWPPYLERTLPPNKRKGLAARVQELVREANNNKLDVIALKDVRDEMAKIRDDLTAKVNEIPTQEYMDAKQFLDDFQQSTVALEKGEAPVQMAYQRFVEGSKSVQDVVDYMLQNGLRFAPAGPGDEYAYRSLYTVLSNYDVQVNSLVVAPLKQ